MMKVVVLLLLCVLPFVLAEERSDPKFRDGVRQRKSSDTEAETDVFAFISDTILANPATVFSKSYCPYCKRAKALLTSKNIEFLAIEMDQVSNGKDIQLALREKTGQRTVPNIFIGGRHIGGFDTLSKLSDEEINKLLDQ